MSNTNLENSKTRIRTEEELFLRKKCLFEIKELLEKNDISFFIWGGLLLGIRRDKDFIKWDWDVEIGLFGKDIRSNWYKIIKLLDDNKFQIINKDYFNLKIDFVKYCNKDVTTFSLIGWRYDFFTGNYLRKRLSVPKSYFSKLYEIDFNNKIFFCPGPINEFLQYFYGDWKNPRKTSIKKDYLSNRINKKNLWSIYVIIDKIINKIFKWQKIN